MIMSVTSISLTDNTQDFLRATKEQRARALEAVGMQAENYAKLLCPVDSGNLKNSITHDRGGEDFEIVGTNVEYAPYVEYGTQRMKAQPYIKPAVEEHVDEYRSIFKEYLEN